MINLIEKSTITAKDYQHKQLQTLVSLFPNIFHQAAVQGPRSP